MNCADARLDEYQDGELSLAEQAATEAHLASCVRCREELDGSRRLETVLRGVTIGAAPDPERYLESIRRRSRGSRAVLSLAAAAALLVGVGLGWLGLRTVPVDVRAEIEKFAERPSAESEARIRAAGPAGLAELERAMGDRSVKVQFAAASLLFKMADPATRDRVLALYQRPEDHGGPWTLSEPGADESDAELVPITVSLAVDGQDRWAMDVLRKLNRLNRAARQKVVDSVVTLLHSTNVEIQRHALEIVKKLEVEFPLTAIVELLDSPELGGEALRFLRQETGQDQGLDKAAWMRAIGGRR